MRERIALLSDIWKIMLAKKGRFDLIRLIPESPKSDASQRRN
jgi:hypothetical protein